MPEPIVEGEKAPETNAFGENIKKEGEAKPQENAGGEDKGGDDKGGDGKGEGKITPTQQIADLSRKLGEYAEKERSWGETQKSKDENIRAMSESIEKLKKQVGEKGEDNKGKDAPVLFKEIKTSKDLTEAEKEDMTDTEVKQFDEIAGLKTALNQLAGMIGKGENKEEAKGEDKINTNTIARDAAKELAGGDRAMANQIIESLKVFNLEGLTEEQIIDRVGKAATFVKDYKPPKEQASGGKGKPAGGGTDTDPYGVDKIVEDVHKQKENEGFNL